MSSHLLGKHLACPALEGLWVLSAGEGLDLFSGHQTVGPKGESLTEKRFFWTQGNAFLKAAAGSGLRRGGG